MWLSATGTSLFYYNIEHNLYTRGQLDPNLIEGSLLKRERYSNWINAAQKLGTVNFNTNAKIPSKSQMLVADL